MLTAVFDPISQTLGSSSARKPASPDRRRKIVDALGSETRDEKTVKPSLEEKGKETKERVGGWMYMGKSLFGP